MTSNMFEMAVRLAQTVGLTLTARPNGDYCLQAVDGGGRRVVLPDLDQVAAELRARRAG